MFGSNDDENKDEAQPTDLEVPTPDQEEAATDSVTNDEQPAVSDSPEWQHPGTPLDDKPADVSQPRIDVVSPAGGFPRSTDTQINSHAAPSPPPPPINDDPDPEPTDTVVEDLVDIRQHALTELAPLLDQLELNPEDRFRTIMMVIQASDDQKLVKEAYEAAHGITDEKVRAQALLDIVNEINYFTQSPST